MKAIVLTFDKYEAFSTHMIQCYLDLWPNNPLEFLVPYQDDEVKERFISRFGNKVEMIKSPSGIVDTIFTLLEGLDEDEWVFWCMDDRYPISLDVPEIEKMYDYILSDDAKSISALMYVNSPWCWLNENLYKKNFKIKADNGHVYLRRKGYRMIWIHQFMKVKVIRTLFSNFPRKMKQAKEMDYIMYKLVLPDEQRLYMLDHNVGVYGESTSRGLITKNTVQSFAKRNIPLPDGFGLSDKCIIQGTNTQWDNFIYRIKWIVKRILKIENKE